MFGEMVEEDVFLFLNVWSVVMIGTVEEEK